MEQFKINLVGKMKAQPQPKPVAVPGVLHSVTLTIAFSDGLMGTDEEQAMVTALRADIEGSLRTSGVLLPDEFGIADLGTALLKIEGDDADLIWAAIADLLEKCPFQPGSIALKKYADREEVVDLTTLA